MVGTCLPALLCKGLSFPDTEWEQTSVPPWLPCPLGGTLHFDAAIAELQVHVLSHDAFPEVLSQRFHFLYLQKGPVTHAKGCSGPQAQVELGKEKLSLKAAGKEAG